jgi:hypothetical protein
MGSEGIEENDGGGSEFNYDVFGMFKNICKCHSVPLSNTTRTTCI